MKPNKVDLHTHSVLSTHAYSSLTENIEYAESIGLEIYGISEHQSDDVGVGAHRYSFAGAARACPKYYKNMRVLVGVELNILDDHFDLHGIEVNKLAYCIASMHDYVYPSRTHTYEENTKNYLMAINTPYVTFLGHIDQPFYKYDHEKVIKEVSRKHKFIELNNSSLVPDSFRKGARENDYIILDLCKKYNVPILMNTDAHIKYKIGDVDYAIDLLEEVNFPKDLILNYHTDELMKYLNIQD